jgi:7,8-dihydroneopterin aldolase/epimerase/oxygenase
MNLSNFKSLKNLFMGIIGIENMEFYSFHGHYREERIIGNRFIVDLHIVTSLDKASKSDDLSDTLNYQLAYELVKEQMQIKSHLLENVARRILDSLYGRFSSIDKATVKVSKLNPSMGGQIERVSVTMSR